MNNQELINKIQGLKQIKPNQNWVSLTKAEVFNSPVVVPMQKTIFANVLNVFAQKRLAYAFAMLLVAMIGTVGYLSIPTKNGQVALKNEPSAQVLALRNNVAEFKAKSQILADLAQSGNSYLVVNEVKEVARVLSSAIKQDPTLAREVALDINNNKTLLDIAGGNSVEEVSDMYETIVVSLIADLHSRTLTQDQTKELERIQNYLDNNQDYATALRDILLISQIQESNK